MANTEYRDTMAMFNGLSVMEISGSSVNQFNYGHYSLNNFTPLRAYAGGTSSTANLERLVLTLIHDLMKRPND